MKRILSFIIPLITVGCTQSYEDVDTISTSEEFYATIEVSSADTRTYVDENITTRWHADDRLTIFKKETYNREYKFKGKTGENSGGFTQVSVDDDFYSSETLDKNYAIYPHSNDNRFIKQTESFEITMPAEQTYAENTFGRGANTMVAVSETGQLLFKNVGSFLRVRLWGEDTAVSSITITSNGDEVIAGEATVKPTLGGDPTCVMTGSTKSITLNCPTPVTISKSESTPTDFWIVLPPVTFENGFTVTVKDSNDSEQTYDVDKSFTFARNTYYNLKREVTICEETTQPTEIPNNQIWYTTKTGEITTVNETWWDEDIETGKQTRGTCFGANIISHIYENGKGVITFDGDVTKIESYNAFPYTADITSIRLPNSVTKIGEGTFRTGYGGILDIKLGNGVITIGEGAFCGCQFSEIVLPESLQRIDSKAFSGCVNLKEITIPNNVEHIGEEVFRGCVALKNLKGKFVNDNGKSLICNNQLLFVVYDDDLTHYTIPNSVTTIGAMVFYNQSGYFQNLQNISIPNTVTSIGEYAFTNCDGIKTLDLLHIMHIGQGAFYGCKNLTTVTIGNSMRKEILPYTFANCSSLTNITIGDNVTAIMGNAFDGCTSITSMVLPESIRNIGDFEHLTPFKGCSALNTLYCKTVTPPAIHNGLYHTIETIYVPIQSIEKYTTHTDWIDYTDKIVGYNFVPNNEIWYTATNNWIIAPHQTDVFGANMISNIYYGIGNGKGIISFDDEITKIGVDAFLGCETLTSVTLPNSITELGAYAFSQCAKLKDVYIPNGVAIIPECLFFMNPSLKNVTMPNSVTEIGIAAFSDCTSLKNVTIPNSVTEIGIAAFSDCTSLTKVIIPNNVVKIGGSAFANCTSLKTIYCHPETPPTLEKYALYLIPSTVKIYVPSESVNAYKSADGWSNYADNIVGYNFE